MRTKWTAALTVGLGTVGIIGWGSTRAPAMLRPGSSELVGTHFASRCDSSWFVSRAAGDSVEHAMPAQRLTERVTKYRGRPAVLLITEVGTNQPYVDSALVYRDGLAPIWETSGSGARKTRYDYEGNRVRITIPGSGSAPPTAREHRYPFSVFNFQELDALIRSLPLRSGYEALLPLYSESDDSVEVDTVRVESRGRDGVWTIRFADPAVVATIGVAEQSRRQVGYSHTFRKAGPRWNVGMVWRRAYVSCGP